MSARARLWVPVLVAALSAACSCSSPTKTVQSASAPAPVPAVPEGRVDSLLRAAWQKQGITPTPAADDATFLRRATLDMWGVLPSEADRKAFSQDTSPDKRAHLIDKLLADPRFSERFAVVWTDLLLGEGKPSQGVDRAAFRSWLRARVEARAPWDSIVRDIVSGEGKNSPGGSIKDRAIASQAPVAEVLPEDIHGNVNYLLRYRNAVEDLTGKTSRAFLGIQIQCAQCHDHKTEAWTTDQFKGLAAAFIKTRGVPTDGREKGEMTVLEVKDMPRAKLGPKATDGMKAIADKEPRALDGTSLGDKDRRRALAEWIASPKNPTFAKAFVNRLWSQLLGSGFVEPVDDFRPGNPAALPELLDSLASGFVASRFDVRGLVRTACLSEAYQRSAGPPAGLWSSFALRPLAADVLFDAVVSSAGLAPLIEDIAGERAELVRAQSRRKFVLIMDVDEDAGTHRFEGSIAHALLLSNGVVTRVAARAVEGGALLPILRGPGDDDAKIDSLYEITLSRRATPEEHARWKKFLSEDPGASKSAPSAVAPKKQDPLGRMEKRLRSRADTPKERAFEDLYWALLNSSEMALQH